MFRKIHAPNARTHTCTHKHTHTHAYKRTYIHSHTHMQLFPELSFQTHMRMYTYTCPHALTGYTDTHKHALSHTRTHSWTCKCTHTCTCTDRHREMMWCQEDAGVGGTQCTLCDIASLSDWHSQQTHHRLTILSFLFWCFLQYPHRAIKPQRLWTKGTPGNELLRVLDSCDTCLLQNHQTVKSSGLCDTCILQNHQTVKSSGFLWHLHFTKSSDCKHHFAYQSALHLLLVTNAATNMSMKLPCWCLLVENWDGGNGWTKEETTV